MSEDNIDQYITDSMGSELGESAPPADAGTEPPAPVATEAGEGTEQVSAPQPSAQPTDQPPEQPTGQQGPTSPAGSGGVRSDASGNLVDAQGKVVANRGAERRLYDQVQQGRAQNNTLSSQLQHANIQLTELKSLSDTMKTKGLSTGDVELGATMMQAMKSNPLSTAQWAIKQAMGQGVDLKTIVGDQATQSGFNVDAIRAMLDERLKPFEAQQTEQRESREQEQRIEQQYQQFISSHDNATTHEPEIAAVAKANPTWSMEKCYYELRTWAAEKQLDFTLPLRQQMEAPRSAPTTPGIPSVPLPTGGTTLEPPTNSGVDQGSASADEDWTSIVRQSMQEAGMQFN